MTNQNVKPNEDNLPSTSIKSDQIEYYSKELDSLTSFLVQLCLTNSDVCEQESIANFILKKLNNDKMSITFNFIELSPVICLSSFFQLNSELIEKKENKMNKIIYKNNSIKSLISTQFLEETNEEKFNKIIKNGNLFKKKIDEKDKEIKKNKIYKEENQKKFKLFSEKSFKSKNLKKEQLFSRTSSKRKIKQKIIKKSKSNLDFKLCRPNTSNSTGGNTKKKLKSSPIYQNRKETFSGDRNNKKENKKLNESIKSPSLVEYILKAIELTNNSSSLFVFCKLLIGYIEHCEQLSIKQNRQKFLVKLDIINCILRAIKNCFDLFKLKNCEEFDYIIIDILAKTILLFHEKVVFFHF
ncbi:hypothetical protein Mgra_00001764 [Meloidogyne graminicola]|uniref:Uncharacterized protein n=1 Tax=Meloidogyne graminicola TaxID=189291 RepID=A0A8S9ZZE5_9BILA|nr:hypothetical protein Mgra_00001764 [Meloidogyne graminicola]